MVGVDARVQVFELGHVLRQMLKVERLQGTGQGVAAHANRTTSVDEQYLASAVIGGA